MTPLERFRRTLAGEATGGVACWPQTYLYPVNFCPGGMGAYCRDARAYADAQLRAMEFFQYDGVGAGPDITM
jgi:uroporphyrinogen-III decarboxylase